MTDDINLLREENRHLKNIIRILANKLTAINNHVSSDIIFDKYGNIYIHTANNNDKEASGNETNSIENKLHFSVDINEVSKNEGFISSPGDAYIKNNIGGSNPGYADVKNKTYTDNARDSTTENNIGVNNVRDNTIENKIGVNNVRDNTLENNIGVNNVRDNTLENNIGVNNVRDNTLENNIGVNNVRDHTMENNIGVNNIWNTTLKNNTDINNIAIGIQDNNKGLTYIINMMYDNVDANPDEISDAAKIDQPVSSLENDIANKKIDLNKINITALKNELRTKMITCSYDSIHKAANILLQLYQNPHQPGKKLRSITGLSEDGMAKQIKALKKRGLIVRTGFQTYQLTGLSNSILANAVQV